MDASTVETKTSALVTYRVNRERYQPTDKFWTVAPPLRISPNQTEQPHAVGATILEAYAMTARELQEKRLELAKRMEQMRDDRDARKSDWSTGDETEWTANWDALQDDFNAVDRDCQIAEAVERATATRPNPQSDAITRSDPFAGTPAAGNAPETATNAPTDTDRANYMAAWFRAGKKAEEITPEQWESCKRLGVDPRNAEFDIRAYNTQAARSTQRVFRTVHETLAVERATEMAEQRALSVGTTTAGGFTVPEGFVNALEISMLAFGGMLQVAEIMRTATGNDMPWPTANDTGNTGELLAENGSIGSSVDPTFAQVVFQAYKYSSKPILVSSELMQDSAFDMAAVIGAMLGERLGRISNTHFTTGTGSSQPNGLVTASALGVTAAAMAAITADELISLQHSVDPAYRNAPTWMMHDSTISAIRKLKDADDQYLWQSGLRDGVPNTLLGRPLVTNQDMATLATGNKTVLYGDLSKYKIRQVQGIRLVRMDERYADNDQVGFVAFLRQDGDLLDAGTDPVKHLIQA